jgi:D-alanyl-D-alanine carboxypeptidase (penicillin-binding protein 5/6)
VLNAPTTKIRFSESTKMMDYGFANFELVSLLKKDQPVENQVTVYGGKEEIINGVVSQDVNFLIKTGDSKEYERETILDEKIKAPLKKGDKIGTLYLKQNDKLVQSLDIVSDRDVLKANVFDYFKKIFNNWVRK